MTADPRDVAQAEAEFLRLVRSRHATRGKPVIVGNCQGGWAAMLVGALDPDCSGPIVVNGAPMSYWAGNDAENPMRYAGGKLGGSWTALLASDLGGGKFRRSPSRRKLRVPESGEYVLRQEL